MGIQQMLLGSSGTLIAVTVGASAGVLFGYSPGAAIGAVLPTTINGFPIEGLATNTASFDFQFDMTGSGYAGGAAGLFSSITVQDQAGTGFRTFTAASATFVASKWTWGTGSTPVWTAGAVTRNVTIN